MRGERRNYLEGWYLLGAISLTLTVLALWLASMRGFEVDGVRMVVRYTARSSLLLFCLAFSAAALARLRPGPFTHWLLRNRCMFGLSFAFSPLIPAVPIIAFAVMAPPLFRQATSIASFVFGGIGYGF